MATGDPGHNPHDFSAHRKAHGLPRGKQRKAKVEGLAKLIEKVIKRYDANPWGCHAMQREIEAIRNAPGILQGVKAAAQNVSDCWEQGDLASAVHDLLCEAESL